MRFQAWLALGLAIGLVACSKAQQETKAPTGVSVRVAKAELGVVEELAYGLGVVRSRQNAVLGAELPGRVEAIFVEVGDRVRKGQVLARIEAKRLREAIAAARNEAKRLQAQYRQAERAHRRLLRLHAQGFASDDALDAARAKAQALASALAAARARVRELEAQWEKRLIRAPFSGRVQRRFVSKGDFVGLGKPVVAIAAAHGLIVESALPPTEARRLRAGMDARIVLADGQVLASQVIERASAADARDVVPFRVAVPEGAALFPGERVRVEVVLERRKAVLVPQEAIVLRPSGFFVFTIEQGRAKAIAVQPGLFASNGMREVRTGLDAGMVIVRDGAGWLEDGDRVQPIQERGDDAS